MIADRHDRSGRSGGIDRGRGEASCWMRRRPWKARIPGGVVASKLVVFPIRSELLPRLRRDLARAGADPSGRPGLPQQTRIDDLYFDPRGRIHVVGLCINQGAYLTLKNNAANPVDDPRSQIALAIGGLFKGYPLPQGVERKVVAHIVADKVAFEENPVRRLQRWANEARLDDVLFRDARFDGDGALTIDGFLGDEPQRATAAETARAAGVHPDLRPARPGTARGAARRGRVHDGPPLAEGAAGGPPGSPRPRREPRHVAGRPALLPGGPRRVHLPGAGEPAARDRGHRVAAGRSRRSGGGSPRRSRTRVSGHSCGGTTCNAWSRRA